MKVASGLASGRQAVAELAEEAVHSALAAAGLERAASVLLFLTHDFSRQTPAALCAAARAAGSLQVFGSTASGLFSERGILLDQAGAAALVIGDSDDTDRVEEVPILSFSGHSSLPFDWQNGIPRVGLLDADAQTWAHGRLNSEGGAEFRIPGRRIRLALSTGLRQVSAPLPVEACAAYELRQVAGQSAVASLRRNLPVELRERVPVHQIAILRRPDEPATTILSANADGSLTLSDALVAGERISWAVRQPLAAEQDMRQSLRMAGDELRQPDFGLMFSCIGRGPVFYGGDDRDQLAFREQFPGVPLLGTYGHGQIAPAGGKNRLFHNAVITLLFAGTHV